MARLKITEDNFQGTIIDMAHAFGYAVAHFRPARVMRHGVETYRTAVSADGKGFPDLVLVKNIRFAVGRCIFAEVKSDSGILSPTQVIWLDLLSGCEGNEVYVWAPRDADEIEEILSMGHPPNLIERASLESAWVNRKVTIS